MLRTSSPSRWKSLPPSSSGFLRLAFYSPSTNGLPGALVQDCGQTSSGTAQEVSWTPGSAVALPAGMVWVGVVAQTSACSVRGLTAGTGVAFPFPSGFTPASTTAYSTLTQASVTSGFPNPAVPTSASGNSQPRFYLQAS